MLVSITLSVQTAINRFCLGSVDFFFRTNSVLLPGYPRIQKDFQMLAFRLFRRDSSVSVDGVGHICFPGLLGVTGVLSVEAHQQLEALAAWSGGEPSDVAI